MRPRANATGDTSVAIEHTTFSVFLLTPTAKRWNLGLIQHARPRRWMLPGGHVESDDNPAEAARRKVEEEIGHQIEPVACSRFAAPGRMDQQEITLSLWGIDEYMPAEPRQPSDHIHIDFLYAATTRIGTPRDRRSWAELVLLGRLGSLGTIQRHTPALARIVGEPVGAVRRLRCHSQKARG